MKVLMLGTKGKGGMYSVVNSYLDSDINKTYPIKFIPTHDSGNIVKRIFIFIKSLFVFLFYIFNKDYAIVHVHFSKSGSFPRKYIIVILSKLFRKKIIIQTHGGEFFKIYNQYPRIVKKMVKSFFGMSDAILVLSEIRKKEYSNIAPKNKIFVIPNFVSVPELDKKPHKAIKIIYMGVLSDKKGVQDLIKSAKYFVKEDFIIYIAGEGELAKYRKQTQELNLANKINFLGWIDGAKKDKLFREADIFVLPSYYEDLPMSILEAMSYGLPIISTNIAGIPELVTEGSNGYLVTPGDVKSLANRLKKLILNKKLRETMGKHSINIIKTKYEKSLIEQKIINLYGGLIKNG
jgi:glycosyltransferase involved in cell wall biosynthesis